MKRKMIIGNWKMNHDVVSARRFLQSWNLQMSNDNYCICGIAANDTLLMMLQTLAKNNFLVVAQNINEHDGGAYTGETSCNMLKMLEIKYTLIGHSERRIYFHESNQVINKKLKACIKNNIIPILCVGETETAESTAYRNKVLKEQLFSALEGLGVEAIKQIIIAYEPVWAIGTGKTATPAIANAACQTCRKLVSELTSIKIAEQIYILYGGSVNGKNVRSLLSQTDIDGALVGSASVKIADFVTLVKNI